MITKKVIIYENFARKIKYIMLDKTQLQKAIGKKIKELRTQKNIPQQDLSAKCNFEKSNMARIESGNTNPTIYTLYKIATNLDITLEELIADLK